MTTATETGTPVILMGRCVICKSAFRVDIPAGIAERFGRRLPFAIPYAIAAAGMEVPRCRCREGVRCEENPLGQPACGDSWCEGHGPLPLKFAAVKVEYAAEVRCGGSCWAAKCSNCTCSCNGQNHGGMHAQAMRGI
jgi:hypothetical protein